MNKLMNNDVFLRIISLVIAILCWVYIVFITNPQIEVKVSGIPITLADRQVIKDAGYVVSSEINTTVDIKLRGTRKILANVNRDNIIAYVDLYDCKNKGTYKLPVQIKLPYEEISVVSKSVYNISVAVDNMIFRSFDVDYEYVGELRSQNYVIADTKLSQDKVTVSGSEDVIKTIEKAVVSINPMRSADDFEGSETVRFLNSNNTEINPDILDISDSTISYECKVYERKKFQVRPSVADSEGIKCTVTDYPDVTLLGSPSDIDKISNVKTYDIPYDKSSLPHTYRVKLDIPDGVEVDGDILYVNVLVESK